MKVILTKLILIKEVHCAEYWEMITTGFALQRLVKQAGSQTRRQDKNSVHGGRELILACLLEETEQGVVSSEVHGGWAQGRGMVGPEGASRQHCTEATLVSHQMRLLSQGMGRPFKVFQTLKSVQAGALVLLLQPHHTWTTPHLT